MSLTAWSFILSLRQCRISRIKKCDCMQGDILSNLPSLLCGVVLQLVCLAGLQAEGQTCPSQDLSFLLGVLFIVMRLTRLNYMDYCLLVMCLVYCIM